MMQESNVLGPGGGVQGGDGCAGGTDGCVQRCWPSEQQCQTMDGWRAMDG